MLEGLKLGGTRLGTEHRVGSHLTTDRIQIMTAMGAAEIAAAK